MSPTTPRVAVAAVFLLASAPLRAEATGTLDRLVGQVHTRFVEVTKKQPVARQDLALAVRHGAGEVPARLVGAVRDLVMGKLATRGFRGVAAVAATGTASQRQARARRGGFELLLDLEVTIHEGYLHLQGNLMATDRHLWRDMLQPRRGTLSHLHASVRVDAEVRAFQGSVKTRALRYTPRRHALAGAEVLALASGDLDGDGSNELVALRPGKLTVLRLRAGKLQQVASLDLPSPSSPLRPRRVMGTLVLADTDGDGRAEVLARSSEQQQGAHLALVGKDLVVKGALTGYPLLAGPGKAARLLAVGMPGKDMYDGTRLATDLAAAAPNGKKKVTPPRRLPAAFYSFKSVEVSMQKGGTRRHLGLVDTAGRLHLYAVQLSTPSLIQAGAGVAFDLADLDDDGTLEVVLSGTDAPSAGDDRVVVRRFLGKRLSRVLWRSPRLGGPVTALTHGDLDGDGRLEVVAGVLGKGGKTNIVVLD